MLTPIDIHLLIVAVVDEGDVSEERKEKEVWRRRRMAGFLRRLLAALAVGLGDVLAVACPLCVSFSSSLT